MASLLKLLIDFPCQVYIDYEIKGNAEPGVMFKIPLRKGTYVLQLKSSDILLYEQEYRMVSNEEEELLRINIKDEDKETVKEKQFWEISSMDVSIKEDEENGLYLLNNNTGEKYIIDLYNDPFSYNVYYSKEFDACGLLKVTLYRDGFNSNYTALVNKVGHIQIGGYSNIAPFNNEQITVACDTSKDPIGRIPVRNTYYLIDKWGNHKSLKYDYLDMNGFIGNCCIVGKNTRDEFGQIGTRYGLIDRKGELVLECNNWEIETLISLRSKRVFVVKYLVNRSIILNNDGKIVYEDGPHSIDYYYCTGKDNHEDIINQDFRFIIEKEGKYGIQDFFCNTLLDFEYDSIKRIGDSSYLSYVKDGVIGFFDPKLHNVPIDFEFVDTIEEGLIRKKNKYGMIKISIESDTLRLKEVIPCKYDVYKECRHVCSAPFTYFFMKKQKDGLYLCDAFYTGNNNPNGTIKKVKSFICQEINEDQSENNSFVVKNNDKWGIVDEIECKYDEIKKGFGGDTLIKENGKWGILYRTDCIYDKILYAYYGRYAVVWSENDKKYIGYIDKVGIYKREVDKSEVLVDFDIFANEKPVIFTVVDDGKINPRNNYYGVPRKAYLCRESDKCNKPEELISIDYALSCNKIWSLSDGNGGIIENKVGVERMIAGGRPLHDKVHEIFSFKTMSFVKGCDDDS